MDPIAKALEQRGDTLAEVAELLYGDGAWEYVSKKSTSDQQRRERRQAQVGLASNILGLAAGTAGTAEAARQYRDAKREATGAKPYGAKHRGTGRIASLKPIKATAGLIRRHPVKVAAAGLGLQVGNVAGDAVANRVLARSAKKDVSKGLIKDSKKVYGNVKQTANNAERASEAAASSAEKVERLIPSQKKAAVIGAGAVTALGASTYGASYYGTKHGTKAALKPKKQRKYKLHTVDTQAGTVEKKFDWDATFEISKKDDDKRQVFGWASVITKDGAPVVDLQDDYMAMETIEKAAYDYVKSSRKGGDMHRRNGAEPHHVSDMIESFVVTEEKKEKLGLPADFPTGWLVGFQVNDEDTWKLVKDGKRTQFSIHGSGQRVEKVLD